MKNLKLGNIYVMQYNDHFRTPRWVDDDDPNMLVPVILKAYGKLVAITPTQYNLEHAAIPEHGQRAVTGVMRSCVIAAHDLGPDPCRRK
jgi:hypothetical protein